MYLGKRIKRSLIVNSFILLAITTAYGIDKEQEILLTPGFEITLQQGWEEQKVGKVFREVISQNEYKKLAFDKKIKSRYLSSSYKKSIITEYEQIIRDEGRGGYGGDLGKQIYSDYLQEVIDPILLDILNQFKLLSPQVVPHALKQLIYWLGQERKEISTKILEVASFYREKDTSFSGYYHYLQGLLDGFGEIIPEDMNFNRKSYNIRIFSSDDMIPYPDGIKEEKISDGLVDPLNFHPQLKAWVPWRSVMRENIQKVIKQGKKIKNENGVLRFLFDNYVVDLFPDKGKGNYYSPINKTSSTDGNSPTYFDFSFSCNKNSIFSIDEMSLTCCHRPKSLYYHLEEHQDFIEAFKTLLFGENLMIPELETAISDILFDFANSSTLSRGQASITKWLLSGLAKLNGYSLAPIQLKLFVGDQEHLLPDDQIALTFLYKKEFLERIKGCIKLKQLQEVSDNEVSDDSSSENSSYDLHETPQVITRKERKSLWNELNNKYLRFIFSDLEIDLINQDLSFRDINPIMKDIVEPAISKKILKRKGFSQIKYDMYKTIIRNVLELQVRTKEPVSKVSKVSDILLRLKEAREKSLSSSSESNEESSEDSQNNA